MNPERSQPINVPRLVSLAEWATAEDARAQLGLPSAWDQEHWITLTEGTAVAGHCGTAACLAGKIALEDGGRPWLTEDGDDLMDDHVLLFGNDEEPAVVQVSKHARDALGLTVIEADRLFSGNNQIGDVLVVVGELLEQAEREARAEAEGVDLWATSWRRA